MCLANNPGDIGDILIEKIYSENICMGNKNMSGQVGDIL